MAKAKSLLDEAKSVERTFAPNWQARLPEADLKQIRDVIAAYKRHELPGWSVSFMHGWLKQKIPRLKVGLTQFRSFVIECGIEGEN